MELWIDSRLGIGGSAPFSCHFCLGMRHGLHQVFTICLRRIKLELLSNLCCQWIPHSTKKKEDFNWADKTFAKINQDQELSKFSFIFRSFVLRSAQLYNMIHIFFKTSNSAWTILHFSSQMYNWEDDNAHSPPNTYCIFYTFSLYKMNSNELPLANVFFVFNSQINSL